MALADFSRASALGFQQGQQMAEGQNPLGQFVRGMLDEYRKKKAMEQEYGMKKDLLKTEQDVKSKSPLGIAELAKTQAEAGLKGEELKVYQEAKTKYDAGDKSPEVLKALGMYATPNIFNMIGSDFATPSATLQNNPLPIVDYKKLSEQELFAKAKAGDKKAKEEAKKRGYIKK